MKESEKQTCGYWSLLFLLFIYDHAEPLWFKLKDNYIDKCVKIETCSLVDPAGADRTRTQLLHIADLSHGLQQQILGKEKGIPMWIILKNDFSHQRKPMTMSTVVMLSYYSGPTSPSSLRARIVKLLRSLRFDSKEPIPPSEQGIN